MMFIDIFVWLFDILWISKLLFVIRLAKYIKMQQEKMLLEYVTIKSGDKSCKASSKSNQLLTNKTAQIYVFLFT